VHAEDTVFDVFSRAAAARAAGCRTTVSSPPELAVAAKEAVQLLDSLTDSWGAAIEFVTESDEQLCELVRSQATDRIRYAAPSRVSLTVRQAAAESLQYIADTPPTAHGRVELLWYFQEQSLSSVYHRYGNLGARINEPRDEPS
jgi:RHH-type proline utilization regulon transcriptional repressor/proline dehydrogenase/delta 1-pyrroline-5-carboxylate dehydrogenase